MIDLRTLYLSHISIQGSHFPMRLTHLAFGKSILILPFSQTLKTKWPHATSQASALSKTFNLSAEIIAPLLLVEVYLPNCLAKRFNLPVK